jgi:uncharacterized protein (DUF1778 family)
MGATKGRMMAQPLRQNQDTQEANQAAPREARLEVRLTQEQKSMIVRAAATRGASVADFVRGAIQEAALQAVTEHDVLRLCVDDQVAFANALLAPREPSDSLRAAFNRYLEQVET